MCISVSKLFVMQFNEFLNVQTNTIPFVLSCQEYSCTTRVEKDEFCVQVMDMRHMESQVLHEEAPSEHGSSMVGQGEPVRHRGSSGHGAPGNSDTTSPMYNFNLSFEELSNVGLDEQPRHNNPQWMVSVFLAFAKFFLNSFFRSVLTISVALYRPLPIVPPVCPAWTLKSPPMTSAS